MTKTGSPVTKTGNVISYEEVLNEEQVRILQDDFSRLKNACYLDHGGATLYAKSQIDSSTAELQSALFSNPHSRNPSSSITTDAIDYIRHRILDHFGTSEDEYSVIFTSGATSALKIVAESFSFNGGLFAYLEETHTSVVGMREFLLNNPNRAKYQVPDLNSTSASSQGDPPPGHSATSSHYSRPTTTGPVCSSSDGRVYCISKPALDKLMDPALRDQCGCSTKSSNDHDVDTADWNLDNEPHRCPDSQISSSSQDEEGGCGCGSGGYSSPIYDPPPPGPRNALMAYPAQCNFSGLKYPLEWIAPFQIGHLEGISQMDQFYIDSLKQEDIEWIKNSCPNIPNARNKTKSTATATYSNTTGNGATEGTPIITRCCKSLGLGQKRGHKWFVLLDAASFVATNRLDLSKYPADFVALSFYKMFGWPTGLGALIVRKQSAYVLDKRYFGGGTVNISIPSKPFHVMRDKLHERFEDGTISFLSILAIRHGLDTLKRLCGSMENIRTRTFRLAQYFYKQLVALKYPDGQPVARIYSDTEYESETSQGPVVTFNLLRTDGTVIGYSEMEQIAYLHDVHLRYGCFCNPGACRRHLGLTADQVLKHYEAGHVCGDLRDIIDGHPTGAIRVSFGYMSSKGNADFLLKLIHKSWIQPFTARDIEHKHDEGDERKAEKVDRGNKAETVSKEFGNARRLLRIFVYPVKSCAPFEVKSAWAIGPHGLLYDREWLIVNSAGVPLTSKREPNLCRIRPRIDISEKELVLTMQGFEDCSVPLEVSPVLLDQKATRADMCTSKVCGDTVMGLDCGEGVSNWLSRVLSKPGLKLIRMSPDHHRKPRNSLDEISLANQSQFLLLSMGSLRQLARDLISKGVVSSLIPTTTTTTVNDHQDNVDNHTTTSSNVNINPRPNGDDEGNECSEMNRIYGRDEDDKDFKNSSSVVRDERAVVAKLALGTDPGSQVKNMERDTSRNYSRPEGDHDLDGSGGRCRLDEQIEEGRTNEQDGIVGSRSTTGSMGANDYTDANNSSNNRDYRKPFDQDDHRQLGVGLKTEEDRIVENLIGRFRGNFVISSPPSPMNASKSDTTDLMKRDEVYVEETWKHVQIGSSTFKSGGPCIRCATICMDPSTGTRGSEPFLTLSASRQGRPNFGIHLYALPQSKPNPTGSKIEVQTHVNSSGSPPKKGPVETNPFPKSLSSVYNPSGRESHPPQTSQFLAIMHIGDFVQVSTSAGTTTEEETTTTTSSSIEEGNNKVVALPRPLGNGKVTSLGLEKASVIKNDRNSNTNSNRSTSPRDGGVTRDFGSRSTLLGPTGSEASSNSDPKGGFHANDFSIPSTPTTTTTRLFIDNID